ncbi:MAG: hypothetical protein F9K30_09300 [Dechloromonas sp.]|nr:MAG: hypothetical protein F9K30_09300 [Dechloromonas sp.]
MQTASITKYLFRIRTRNGVLVENLSIFGRDESDAKRKLGSIYRDCEVLQCQVLRPSPAGRNGHLNYEDVVDLIIAS